MLMKELELVKKAILNEAEGFEFYTMAAEKANEQETKDTFLKLAKEENDHIEWLKNLFEKIKMDDWENLELAILPKPHSPEIFKWDKLDRKNTSLALSVFSIGMQMELSSIEFYKEAKKVSNLNQSKELFDTLIQWEKVHYEQFAKEYETLKEEWWSDQGFEPF